MGEWERRWRGPPHDKSLDELPKATVRFLDSLRVMVADTYPGGPGDVVAIRPGDDSDEDDDCDESGLHGVFGVLYQVRMQNGVYKQAVPEEELCSSTNTIMEGIEEEAA